MKKFFWMLDLILLALGAWLLAGIINTTITNDLRPNLTLPDLSDRPSKVTPRVKTRKNNQVITRKNLFQSALTIPGKSACANLSTENTRMLGKPVSSIRAGFEFPDTYLLAHIQDCECRDDWCRKHDSMKCSHVRDTSFYQSEIKGLKRSGTELFICSPRRFSWQEANLICVVADRGKIISWKHLWQQDGCDRQVLAQGGKHSDDGACAWLRERYEP